MKVDDTNLSMTRGDSKAIAVFCEGRPFVEGDTVVLTVKKEIYDKNSVLQKETTVFTDDGRAIFYIYPEDTKELPCGLYKYDVQLQTKSGIVITVVKPRRFIIDWEVNCN